MKHLLKFSLAMFMVLTLMTSCQKNTAEECVCPDTFAPVFDNTGKMYDNACLAECAGVAHYEESPELVATIWFDKTELGSCKWFIRIKDKDYKMSNVDKDYYKDGLQVVVTYKPDLSPPDGPCDPRGGYIDVSTIRISE